MLKIKDVVWPLKTHDTQVRATVFWFKAFLVDVCDILEVMNSSNHVFYRKLLLKR